MSTSLSYHTVHSVDVKTKAEILELAKRINGERNWWCEPLAFFDHPEYADRLTGNTKLFLIGVSMPDGRYVEVSPEDDCLMAYRDARFITECISSWANEYRQDWVLSIEGSEIGRIHNGRVDAKIQRFLSDLLDIVDNQVGENALEDRAAQILVQYAARNTQP